MATNAVIVGSEVNFEVARLLAETDGKTYIALAPAERARYAEMAEAVDRYIAGHDHAGDGGLHEGCHSAEECDGDYDEGFTEAQNRSASGVERVAVTIEAEQPEAAAALRRIVEKIESMVPQP